LPDHTVRLCDGGFIEFDSEMFTSLDSVVGTLASVESMAEGIGDEIPALDLTFAPQSAVAFTTISNGAMQKSEISFWIGEYDPATGLIDGTPDLMFLGFIDQPSLRFGKGIFEMSLSAVPTAEWFFERDHGNSLSATFHKSIYPGETGHDNATGLSVSVAWGTDAPRASFSGGSFSGGPGIRFGESNAFV
jgi:hypothetical protein